MVGKNEAELNRIRSLEDWRIPRAASLRTALTSLDRALTAVIDSTAWEGESAQEARTSLSTLQQNFRLIDTFVGQLTDTIENANSYRRTAASAELPSAQVDPFWANAAKIGSVVVHPVLGPLAADRAVDAIGSFLGNQREEQAAKIIEGIKLGLAPSAVSMQASAAVLASFDPRVAMPDPPQPPDQPGTGVDGPHITSPGGGSIPGGVAAPGGGGGVAPGGGGTGGGGGNGGGGNGDGGNGGGGNNGGGNNGGGGNGGGGNGGGGNGGEDPTIDSPGGGVTPGGGGGTGGGGAGGSGGSGGGSLPGGAFPGGGGIGGAVGGGAGAAAIAAGAKISGFGSMGALGGSGLGGAAGAGVKAGGGLLGSSSLGGAAGAGNPAGTGGRPGAAVGGSGSGTGVAGTGRTGMGMGGAGADDEERTKRPGLGGPIAPKLEDDEERGPRARGAQAGSRDDHDD